MCRETKLLVSLLAAGIFLIVISCAANSYYYDANVHFKSGEVVLHEFTGRRVQVVQGNPGGLYTICTSDDHGNIQRFAVQGWELKRFKKE